LQASNFLISYYEDAQEYERCIQRLNQDGDGADGGGGGGGGGDGGGGGGGGGAAVFAEFQATEPVGNYSRVCKVDYFTTLQLSDKLAGLSDPGMQRIFAGNRATRRALYERCLPESAFVAHDKANWLKLARHFAARTGKPVLDYPFVDHG
jgi:hypothetical protein